MGHDGPMPAPMTELPTIDDHPHYGLSVQLGDRHYLAARSNGPGRGWRVEESHRGLTVHLRATTRGHAYAVVWALAGLAVQDEAVAA